MELAVDIHAAIAKDIEGFGGILHCATCGNWEWVTGTAGYLRSGWPTCCKGYTMRWVTRRQIEEEGWHLNQQRDAWVR